MIREWKPRNRDRKMKPKKGLYWCDHCDAAIVGDWEKCPKCGKRSGIKRLKKETSS